MPDVFDEAQIREAAEREAAIGKVRADAARQQIEGLIDCEGCGEEIPAERRRAVRGARCCIICQVLRDGSHAR